MPKGKRFRVNEVHSILDMLESDPDFLTANLYVLPPADPECSDEDSGDEDKGAPDNLSRRQLQHLSANDIKATGTVRVNRIEGCPVMAVNKVKKMVRAVLGRILNHLI